MVCYETVETEWRTEQFGHPMVVWNVLSCFCSGIRFCALDSDYLPAPRNEYDGAIHGVIELCCAHSYTYLINVVHVSLFAIPTFIYRL
jgi:hypothetical protein